MGRHLTACVFVGLSLMALRANAIEVTINFAGLPDVALSSTDAPLELNDFTMLSTDGQLDFQSSFSSGKAIASAGNSAFFDFAPGALVVKSVTMSGASNNASVTATAFDGGGLVLDQQVSDNVFSTPLVVASSGGISRLQVRLLESEITVMSIELSAVPLPAPVLLLASAVLGVAGVRRLRTT